MTARRPISPKMQDYLEAVTALAASSGGARVADIARRLGVRMPTVNSALRVLREAGLVAQARYGAVFPTPRGRREGRGIERSHHGLKEFLTLVLGAEERSADAEACRLEHAVSPRTMAAIEAMTSFYASPRGAARLAELRGFLSPRRGGFKRSSRK
ncbi:MAG: metal-dependent transcriptional regulator [Elusimicrobiales bacterium]|jgi:DtxR family Mn-dependent transcriptional regulator|nr:metal-dependent transcriptional regulator [Elusimicrobiales bacterium]